jgi:hypothetical protein
VPPADLAWVLLGARLLLAPAPETSLWDPSGLPDPAGPMRNSGRPVYCGCARSFWRGSQASSTCYLHFQISSEIKRSRPMAQSYVGKRTLSKGIGRVIRRFACSSFKSYAFGCRGRVSAQLDGLLRAATSFNCAVAMMQDVLVLWGRGGRLPLALGGEGGTKLREARLGSHTIPRQ